jgi:hypothetical protein
MVFWIIPWILAMAIMENLGCFRLQDWYGRGQTNIGVFDPDTGSWHLDNSDGTWNNSEKRQYLYS